MKTYNYLADILEKSINLKVLLLSHNAYWNELQKVALYYRNFKLTENGGSTSYLDINDQNKMDYDLILFYSSEKYQENESVKLKEIAMKISEENNKRVTVGYSYILPAEERTIADINEEVLLYSVKNGQEQIQKSDGIEYLNTLDLLTLTLTFHNELENQKIKFIN